LNQHKELENHFKLDYEKPLINNADNLFDLPDRFCVITSIKNIPKFKERYDIKNIFENEFHNQKNDFNFEIKKTINNEHFIKHIFQQIIK